MRTINLKTWLTTPDWTWSIQDHARWVVVELDLSVMISCAQALKVIFFRKSKFIPNFSKFSFTAGGLLRVTGRRSTVKHVPRRNPDGPSTIAEDSVGSDTKKTGTTISRVD